METKHSKDCAGGDCCGGISRRQFLGLTAGAAAWSIFGLPVITWASPDHTLTPGELQSWFAALPGPGVRLTYSPKTNPMAAVPMGGIGCGNAYLSVDGTLKDWLIFNNVNPVQIPNTFFAVRTKVSGLAVTRLLQTTLPQEFSDVEAIADTELVGEYPFAFLTYKDAALPVDIRLEAFSPMIPLDAKSSAFPGAVFLFHIANKGLAPVDVSLLMAAQNSAGLGSFAGNVNHVSAGGPLTAVEMTQQRPENAEATGPATGDMCIAVDAPDSSALASWTSPADLLGVFGESGNLQDARDCDRSALSEPGQTVNGAVAAKLTVPAGGEASVPFFLTWRFPNYRFEGKLLGNHYAKRFSSAMNVARKLARDMGKLHDATELYHKTIYDTTLPYWLVDCLTSQSSTIRSEVCVWTAADAFAGFEGAGGCCPMNCTHVWGYEQTLSRLYPELERRMRDADFFHQQNPDGGVNNRIALPLADHPTGERPFADGQASSILKAYRDHLNSPSSRFLKRFYPHVKKAVDYMVSMDGANPDGVLEGEQLNTYDCQVSGANSFIGSYYLAALRAGEEMALLMGDGAAAGKWRSVFESGRKRLTQRTYNGSYFQQDLPGYQQMQTQYGLGCLADQLIGQWWAHQLRLGYVLPEDYIRKAIAAVFKNNWRSDFTGFVNHQRVFADGHDKGLLCCTWPGGGRPANPILYCDEVWTGVEYEVAASLAYEGMLQESLAVVAGARERYDGARRNPWNEVECGGHYARAMSSWSLLLALSGFFYDGPKGILAFNPIFKPEDFKAFFTAAEGWGSFSQKRDGATQRNTLHVALGRVRLTELRLGLPDEKAFVSGTAVLDGRQTGAVSGRPRQAVVTLPAAVIAAGGTLSVSIELA